MRADDPGSLVIRQYFADSQELKERGKDKPYKKKGHERQEGEEKDSSAGRGEPEEVFEPDKDQV
ncbi:MAG TPA: hypothetical protein PKG48_00275 [Bacteroidales bacterium]|nr:hypothetical protein [Bacteroidales bacterium]